MKKRFKRVTDLCEGDLVDLYQIAKQGYDAGVWDNDREAGLNALNITDCMYCRVELVYSYRQKIRGVDTEVWEVLNDQVNVATTDPYMLAEIIDWEA